MSQKLVDALADARRLWAAKEAAMPRVFSSTKPPPEKYRRACAAYESAMNGYASDPALRASMVCWMLDFCGNEEPAWAREKREPTDREMASAIAGTASSLARTVAEWLRRQGATITDSGSGAGGWHIGAHCSDEESRMLCIAARGRFATEIAGGELSLVLQFWGWQFANLHEDRESRSQS